MLKACKAMTAYFVTATGTDIGKTYVTAGLLRAARAAGRAASALKPVMSGYDPTTPENSDAGALLRAMDKPITPETIAALSPWRFSAPLSPDMAAARENRALDLAAITSFCRTAIAQAENLLLIEGVGGAMVPLDETHTVRDWIAALNVPTLLVAGTYLGSISHTLTTLDALLTRNLPIAALLLNESQTLPVPPEETAATLARFHPNIPLHIIPRGHQSFGEIVRKL